MMFERNFVHLHFATCCLPTHLPGSVCYRYSIAHVHFALLSITIICLKMFLNSFAP